MCFCLGLIEFERGYCFVLSVFLKRKPWKKTVCVLIYFRKQNREMKKNPLTQFLLSLLNQVVASSSSLIIFIVPTFVGDSRKPPTTIHVAVSLSLNWLPGSSILRRRPPQDYFLTPITFFFSSAGRSFWAVQQRRQSPLDFAVAVFSSLCLRFLNFWRRCFSFICLLLELSIKKKLWIH